MAQTFIHWNIDPEIFSIGGIALRYYSVLFVGGLVLCAYLLSRMTKTEGMSTDSFYNMVFAAGIGIVFGARLGHCLFYEPQYYLAHPLEILLPIEHLPQGGWRLTGYHGLASHGGAIGLIIALALYAWRAKVNIINLFDLVAVVAPLEGAFIRLGNFMNSEIVGLPTNVPWAVVFQRVDSTPRHPAQLYEAACYLLIFAINIYLYKKWGSKPRHGFFFGLTLTLIFIARFLIEFIKERQVDFELGMTIDMGQWLSLPFILVGVGFMWYGLRRGTKQ